MLNIPKSSPHVSTEFPDEFSGLSGGDNCLVPEFFNRSPAELALNLLGRTLISRCGGAETGGIIVETQAYLGISSDIDSHIYRGTSCQNTDWRPGCLYIYSVQGHTMLTIAAPPYNEGATVLIRALEPTLGLEHINQRVETGSKLLATQGPGRLCKALGITTVINGSNIFENGDVRIESGTPFPNDSIVKSRRLNSKNNAVLRFYVANNKWVSLPR
jgi:DNA-3-methyladenine glycosylase